MIWFMLGSYLWKCPYCGAFNEQHRNQCKACGRKPGR